MIIRIEDIDISHIDLSKPDFENKGTVHDWRNYVFEELEEKWEYLTNRERKIIAYMAKYQADREEWD